MAGKTWPRRAGLLALLALAASAAAFRASSPSSSAQEVTRPRRASAPPQKPAGGETLDEDEVVRVSTSEVLLPVTVRDASGALVTTLLRPDFRVWEDGREQPLSDLSLRQVPVDVALLIDSSSSTADNLEDFRRAAADFASRLGADDRVCLIKFDDRVELLQDWTRSQVQLRRSLSRVKAGMFTRFNEALYLAAREQLKPTPSRRRALVVLSDGIDSRRGRVSDADTLQAILGSQAAVYVISNTEIERRRKRAELDALLDDDSTPPGFNSLKVEDLREGLRVLDASEKGLSLLCSSTGGRLYRPAGFDALGDLYGEIADELRHQYALYYRPTNRARDGAFRRVRVEVSGPGMRVTARVGYYGPK